MKKRNEYDKDYIFAGLDFEKQDKSSEGFYFGDYLGIDKFEYFAVSGDCQEDFFYRPGEVRMATGTTYINDVGRKMKIPGLKGEDSRNRTKEQIEARIIYAMRDSMRMSTREFVNMYDTNSETAPKQGLLHCMDEGIDTELGNVDLDWVITIISFNYKTYDVFSVTQLYTAGKWIWNIKHLRLPSYNINNPAEVKAQEMAKSILFEHKKFHEFFSDDLKKKAVDKEYRPIDLILLMEMYGDNIK